MTVSLSALAGAGQQFFDNNGAPLSGGKLYSYDAGTTTPKTTYTSAAGNVAHTNPIILDSAGRIATGEIWLTAGSNYKFTLATSTDVTIATWDNITGIDGTGITTSASSVSFTGFGGLTGTVQDLADNDGSDWIGFIQTGGAPVARSVQSKLRDVYNVRDWGAVGNGSTDDTTKIQSALTAIPNGAILYFPPGDYITSAALQINKSVTLQGSQKASCTILCLANDGIVVNSANNVNVYDMCIAQAVRHTTTPNSYTGILINGDTVLRPYNHCYRDVYIDGFLYGIYADWIWSAVFDNVRTGYGANGLVARYLSVNNVVTNCSFSGDGTGYGIHIDGLGAGTEGWMISNTLTYNNRFGITGSGATHVYIANCILDYSYEAGISIIADSFGNFGGNFSIINNYIAMGTKVGVTGIAPIHIANTVSSSQNRGCQISNNHLISYAGTTCPYGIFAEYAQGVNNAITGNSLKNFSTNDIRVNADGGTITGNTCLSAITNNIQALGLVSNNTGTVYYQRAVNYASVGKIKITYDEAVPTTGTWNQGDICFKENPAAGGTPGWVCVSGGTPGTWKAMANLAA